ncbi:MAG: alpha/beta hydrolase [Pseudomonadota bacterium]
MSRLQDGSFQHEEITLHYRVGGRGPLMLFVHGFPSCGHSFRHQLEYFARTHRVLAVDALGANRSSKPASLAPYRVPALAAQIDALARSVAGDEPFILVGHDWGGALAWSFAAAWPQRLRAVIVMNAPPYNLLLDLLASDAEQRERSSYMYSMRDGKQHQALTADGGRRTWEFAYAPMRELPHFTEADDEVFREALAQPGAIDGGINWYRANIPAIDDIGDADYWPARGTRIRTPALLLWGETDGTFVPRFIDLLDAACDDLTVVRMADVGHWTMLQAPTASNDAMAAFLDRLPATATSS